MYNPFQSFSMLFHDLECIFRRVAAVDIHRQPELPCKLQLPDEPFLLHFPRLCVPMIVKADLPHGYNLVIFEQLPHEAKTLLIQSAHLIRVDAYRGIHERVSVRHLDHLPAGIKRRAHIYDCRHPPCGHRAQKLIAVFIKLFIIIMCMCIKNHIYSI